jgi:prevent-host-death family protein
MRTSHSRVIGPRSRRGGNGERAGSVTVSATTAKNEFGGILEKAMLGRTVVITKHATPKAVLISIGEFNALSGAPKAALDSLSADFDRLLAGMQRPGARAAMQAAFDAPPKQLGRTARAAARKRG